MGHTSTRVQLHSVLSEMLAIGILVLLLSITKISSSVPGITNTVSEQLSSGPPAAEILPNPYHVPDSPIFLDFYHPAFGPLVPRSVIAGLLDKAAQDATNRLRNHGDGPIASGSQQVKFMNEVFVYESTPPDRQMKYSELLTVIRGFSTKERIDGFRHRLATVLYKGDDGRTVQTGEVGLLERAAADDS